MKLVNNTRIALTLEGGVVLAAAGTRGSVREVGSLSDRDRKRLVERGWINIIETAASTEPEPELTVEEEED